MKFVIKKGDELIKTKDYQFIKPAESDGVMVCFMLPFEPMKEIVNHPFPYPKGSTLTLPTDYHITLKYLGKTNEVTADLIRNVVHVCYNMADAWEPMTLDLPGTVGVFDEEDSDVWYLETPPGANSHMWDFWRELCRQLKEFGIEHDEQTEWTPHVTLAYVPKDSELPYIQFPAKLINIHSLSLVVGEWVVTWELTGIM